MARLPSGWHWINSRDKKQGAIDPSGSVHTRQQAENKGASEVGFKNSYEQRQARDHLRELKTTRSDTRAGRNYQQDLQRAKDAAEARGERFDRAKFDANVSAQGVEDAERAREAKALFLYMTGRVPTVERGLDSA